MSEPNREEQLTAKQEQAIQLLVLGKNPSEIVNELGVNRSTLWRWKTEVPAFIAALNAERKDCWEASQQTVRSMQAEALAVVSAGLHSKNENVQLKAANLILRMAVKSPTGPTSVNVVKKEMELAALLENL